MDFPHLDDTAFPNLENVNAYGYRNVFDYTRWLPNTKIYLTNVRWNGDYADCVKFDDDGKRDEWFDGHIAKTLVENPDCSCVLNTNTVVTQNTVKVPVPYTRATQFNYLVVDVPIMTGADDTLNYESANGFHRWHFFIEDFRYTAPSTTVLTIALDMWTQYINSVGFNYFMLERGHAPVKASDTDAYLANPVDNSEYLLAPDVNFGGATIARGGKFIPFGNGEKYICFASTCKPGQLASLGTVDTGAQYQFTDPVFSDAVNYPDSTNRWGRQYDVSGFGFGNGKSYANVTTPAGNSLNGNGRIPTSATVYAIRAAEANDFVNSVLNTSPTFLTTILSCYMVAKELLTLGEVHIVGGYSLYECVGNEGEIDSIKLTRDMFDIPERYQKFAKLYTFPYSELEITDNAGKSVTVKVEETGDIRAHGAVSLAYPYLNMRLFLTGIGGKGSQSYRWQDLRGSHDLEISNSDWYRLCFDMDIPMYSLYMDGHTSWEIGNYNRSLSNARNSALVNYHNSVREANNAMHNSQDTAATNHTNSVASANTVNSNTVNTANTAQTNTGNDANTMDSNHANSRACATDITANNNAAANANTASHNNQLDSTTSQNNSLNYLQAVAANAFSLASTKEENETSVAISNTNAATQLAGAAGDIAAAAVTGAAAGGVVGALAGAALGAVQSAGSLVGASATVTNAVATAQCNSAVATMQAVYNSSMQQVSTTTNLINNSYATSENTQVTSHNVNAAASNTARSNSCDAANTGNTTSNMRTNAANTRNTQVTNAGNTRDTAIANADRLQANMNSVSDWTDRAAIAAAQDVLRNTQNQSRALSADARNMNPVQLCPSSGDQTPDYMRNRGVQVKVRTQSANAIRAAGDEFTRYGYSINQIWQVDSLCLMKHFTFWKARDVWVYDRCETSDLAQNSISAIFEQGVTVWSDPDEIGRVNPYDN